MTGGNPEGNQITPGMARLLAVSWIGVVMLISACILLAVRWASVEREGGSAALSRESTGTPSAAQEQTGTPPVSSPTPALTMTGAPGMPLITTVTASPAPPPTPLPVEDRTFAFGIEAQALISPDETLDLVRQLNLRWVKQTVRWAEVEPGPGNFNWDALDAMFAAAATRGLKVLVTVTAAPDWSRSVTAEDFDGPPDNPQDFVNFVTQLVLRYRGAIHAIEIWDEMNQGRRWYVAGGLRSIDYMELLIPAAAAIHALDPGIIVISGGLAPTGMDDNVTAIDDFRYMQEMIDAGLLSYVDCVGMHHRGYNLPPDVPYDAVVSGPAGQFQAPFEHPHHSWSFYSTLHGYNDIIIASGHNTPLCVTSFGWAAAINGEPEAGLEFAGDNTPQEQADYIVQALNLMHDRGFVWLAFLFNLDYSLKDPDDLQGTLYSILTPDGSPRPAFEAIQAMSAQP